MDTKSKKFKHSLWFKALCAIASAALIFESVYCASAAASAFSFYGSVEAIGEKAKRFENTSAFYNVAQKDISSVAVLASHMNDEGLYDEISSRRDEEVNDALQQYLLKKASIIEGELYYVATHYDRDDDGRYDDEYNKYVETTTSAVAGEYTTKSEVDASEAVSETSGRQDTTVTTAGKYTDIVIDSFAPKNVQIAQSILKKTGGLGFLEYEGLVREDAFYEQSYEFDGSIDLSNGDVYIWSTKNYQILYDLNEQEARSVISDAFDRCRDYYINGIETDISFSKAELESCVNFKYAVLNESGRVIMTNTEGLKDIAANARGHGCYLIYGGGKLEISGFDGYDKSVGGSGIGDTVRYRLGNRNLTVIAYLESPLVEGDMYYQLYGFFSRNISDSVGRDIVVAIISFVAALLLFVILLCLCGHKNDVEGYSIAYIDKVPGDLHFALSAAAATALFVPVAYIAGSLFSFTGGFSSYFRFVHSQYTPYNEYYTWVLAVISALCAALWLVFTEWLASIVRIVKAGKPYFRNFVTVRLALTLYRFSKRFFRYLCRVFKRMISALSYRPKKFSRFLILAFAVYLLLNVIFAAFLVTGNGDLSLLGLLLLAALNGFVLFKGIKYMRYLDEITDAAGYGFSKIPDADKMPESLKALADGIRLNREELRAAVEKAVKDERTKTELITNVSHDLKTPLTAVISYIDLLKKCDITDETALSYINVLDEKSIKLKRLIEDLIEASKVSTGNVTLNPVGINLTELAVQTIGEMNDLFDENNLDIRFSEPSVPPVIFADSQKTFRIIDNLLNNARKYSEPGSRVYVTVSSNDYYGIFEVKNISREPLNITPEELTERFVRGDKSRTAEGNGLGLSIAKDLCRLQNGRLVISIDGDLFKASVYLPLKGKFVFSGENSEEQYSDNNGSF